MRKIIMIVTLVVLVLVSMIIWNSRALGEFRARNLAKDYHYCCDESFSYRDLNILEEVDFDTVTFYIYEVDEYNGDDEFNAKVYYIVRRNTNFLGMSSYEEYEIEIFYSGQTVYPQEWYSDNGETTLLGYKDVNDYDQVELVLENNEKVVVDVLTHQVLFFFTTDELEIVDVIPIR